MKLKLKPQKSKSLVIKGGKHINKQPFEVAGEINLSIQKEPLKTIGKVNNSSVIDRHLRDDLRKKITELVQKLSKSWLTSIVKVLVYQNLLLAMIGWSLMIFELPLSWVESVEACFNGCLHKWLGASKNMSNVSLCCQYML